VCIEFPDYPKAADSKVCKRKTYGWSMDKNIWNSMAKNIDLLHVRSAYYRDE